MLKKNKKCFHEMHAFVGILEWYAQLRKSIMKLFNFVMRRLNYIEVDLKLYFKIWVDVYRRHKFMKFFILSCKSL